MNTTKLNDWIQIAAAVGIIAGLLLVAYEIRLSNRIGWEQASVEGLQKWDTISELTLLPGVAELFVRAHEGDELSRADIVQLNALTDAFLTTILHDYRLEQTGTLDLPNGVESSYQRVIQLYVGNQYGRRRWETSKSGWPSNFAALIDKAIAAPDQRDVIGELDYIRGVADLVDFGGKAVIGHADF